MPVFACPLCLTNREFSSFSMYFRHITLFHQNESGFEISCNLNSTCGVLYRTFSAYKSHVYRHHSSELTTETNSNISNTTAIDESEQNDTDSNVEVDLIYNDDDDDGSYLLHDPTELDLSNDSGKLSDSNINQEKNMTTLFDIKRSYALFLLQLREEFFVSKNTTNAISTYITTLMNHLQALFEQKVLVYCSDGTSSTSSNRSIQVIQLETLKDTINEVSKSIEIIAKNEYQFKKNCEQYFGYNPPEEIVVSGTDEETEHAFFIPIDETLFSMLSSQSVLSQILDNVQQQRIASQDDDDLMFSIRNGCYGNIIDHDTLLIQLYLDDIGLTNPIGSKRDQHKMSMLYFTLEDVPDQHRSKLDYIHLVGVCESKILKVEIFILNLISIQQFRHLIL